MNAKHLLVANLAAMILLLLTFAPVSTQQESPYNPWIDTNEDGTIDIYDLISMARIYGASGDPTKNVTINHRIISSWHGIYLLGNSYLIIENQTAGYDEINIALDIAHGTAQIGFFYVLETPGGTGFVTLDRFNVAEGNHYLKTYPALGFELWIRIDNLSPTEWMAGTMIIHMTT